MSTDTYLMDTPYNKLLLPKVGRPLKLTQEVADKIVDNVKHGYIPSQICRLTQTPKPTLTRWLKKGCEDAENGKGSIYAQFWNKFEQERGKVIKDLIDSIKGSGKWQAELELLKVFDRENFGNESSEIKELIKNLNELAKGRNDE